MISTLHGSIYLETKDKPKNHSAESGEKSIVEDEGKQLPRQLELS